MGGYALHANNGKRLWALPNAGPEANVTGGCLGLDDGIDEYM